MRKVASICLAVVLVLTLLCTLLACGDTNSPDKDGSTDYIHNASGAKVEGGGFEQGSTLEVNRILLDSNEGAEVLDAISAQDYDTSKPVYIFDISVLKDSVKVQPNNKVKVSIPLSYGVDLTDYLVLHIKDNGSIEKISLTIEGGNAVFETDSFSKFVFVKKKASIGGGDGGGNATKYTLYTLARRVVPSSFNEGGSVLDVDGETITYCEIELAQGTQYTVKSHCYPNHYFVGWYNASDLDEVSEDTFISKDTTYTFTINANMNICAVYAKDTDIVEVRVRDVRFAEFSYRDNEPVKTVVAQGCAENERPDPSKVSIISVQADGTEHLNPSEVLCDDGGLDFDTPGTYTIKYYHKDNPLANAKLVVEVVDRDECYDLDVVSYPYNCRYNYNSYSEWDEGVKKYVYSSKMPEGRLVTLSAIHSGASIYSYEFEGWYDANDTLISRDYCYTFEMPNRSVSIVSKWRSIFNGENIKIESGYGGYITDGFGNEFVESGEENAVTIRCEYGSQVSFTAKASYGYEFVGWYSYDQYKETLLSANEKLEYTVANDANVKAKFIEKVKSLEISSNDDVKDGKIIYTIGDTIPDYQHYELQAVAYSGFKTAISSDKYNVSADVDFTRAGNYTVTYSYKNDTNIQTTLTIIVVDSSSIEVVYTPHRSYLDHEYNGKAAFVSRQDITVNDLSLMTFKDSSKIWDVITYKWIDKATGKEVDTKDADVTINGVVNEYFGPENDKQVVGNEFCGPIEAGEYKFELSVNGALAFSTEATITTSIFEKITTSEEFVTNEGSTWVNYELYYYTIVGVADGKYYVMQMPSIGYSNVEVEAREVTPSSDGKITLGGGRDFAFVNAKYYANYVDQYTEFLTGYYGSYVVLSSDNSSVGMFGTPYIYRTCYTSVSGGHIYREYGTKYQYGNKTEFADDGAVTIYSPNNNETDNTALRLVKDGDKYVFTSVAANTDTRESYKVYIYRIVLD